MDLIKREWHKLYKWLVKHKSVAVTGLIGISSIFSLVSASYQSDKDLEISQLIFDVSNVSVSYGSYSLDLNKILLYRSIATNCKNGTENTTECFLAQENLNEANVARTDLRTNNENWVNLTTTEWQSSKEKISGLNKKIIFTAYAGLFLLLLAVVVNSL